jgi:hypothetical protein
VHLLCSIESDTGIFCVPLNRPKNPIHINDNFELKRIGYHQKSLELLSDHNNFSILYLLQSGFSWNFVYSLYVFSV